MTASSGKPWLSLYPAGATSIEIEFESALDMFAAAVRRAPDNDAVRYFDGAISVAELDRMSDALAAALADRGFGAGDRLALFMQNMPAFVIGLLAAWKAGGVGVSVNPMFKSRELAYLLADSGATALLCLDALYAGVARDVIATGNTRVQTVIVCSGTDHQTRNDTRVFNGSPAAVNDGVEHLLELIARYAGRQPPQARPRASDTALLTYTSGTTGEPKGAMNTHGNVVADAQILRDWVGLKSNESILGVAPLFHITGTVAHVVLSLLVPAPLILAYRFNAAVMLDAIREHRPVFTVGAITALTAIADGEGAKPQDFVSLSKLYSGGAPVAPGTADRLEKIYGHYVHNAYGLTESSSATHLVPVGVRAPVDPDSGALSIGVPAYNTHARILDDDGNELAPGEIGELAISGPQIVPGYWNKPEQTAAALPNGELRTGDVAFMNTEGWFFIVDRKKDMINAAGYKVWPREVEDVLYSHPAVREAAVVGVPDEYRGETVKAYVVLQPDAKVGAEELIAFCKQKMAAYKYPRQLEIRPDLPKTASGKILRRKLRDT